MKTKTRIGHGIRTIKAIRAKHEKTDPFKKKIDVPKLPIDEIVKRSIDIDDDIECQRLTLNLLLFYACNTTTFKCVISEGLQKEIEFNETYIDECCADIARQVQQGNIYTVSDGVFTAWVYGKQKKSKLLTMQQATEFAAKLIEGDF
jgi:hypothetical protein